MLRHRLSRPLAPVLVPVLAVVLTSLILAVTGVGGASGAAAAPTYTPEPGALFNNPQGSAESRHRLAVKLRKTIWSVPRGGVIRIAVYSFDRRDLGDALVAACDRKVSVQLVINDNWISRQVKRLQRKLGDNVEPHYDDACHPRQRPEDPSAPDARPPHPEPSFVKVCYQACRLKGAGNQHMKLYMFSQAGTRDNVVMFGSNNMTYYAARTHWNDMFTLDGGPTMWADYSRIFGQLAQDRPVTRPYRVFQHGDIRTEFGAREGASRDRDPVGRRLSAVRCQALDGTGWQGRTVIRISMYAWVGDRGAFLAGKVADLSRRGCIVRAILSQPAKRVKRILRAGGVKIRSADLNTDEDSETGFGETPWEHFTHEKWMALSGTWQRRGQRIVWTGSENWSNKSLQNDEITVQIPRAGAYRAYAARFDAMWNDKRYTRKL